MADLLSKLVDDHLEMLSSDEYRGSVFSSYLFGIGCSDDMQLTLTMCSLYGEYPLFVERHEAQAALLISLSDLELGIEAIWREVIELALSEEVTDKLLRMMTPQHLDISLLREICLKNHIDIRMLEKTYFFKESLLCIVFSKDKICL